MSIFRPSKEEQIGYAATLVAHIVLLVMALLLYTSSTEQPRTALMEITLGEFSDGTMAEFSREERQEVATDPNPSEVETDAPTPEQVEVTEQPTPDVTEPVKDVDLAEQTEEIFTDEVVVTPETDKIDPTQLTEEVEEQEEEVTVRDRVREAETEQEGARESGAIRAIRGRVDADQGTGQTTDRAAPLQLQWDGDFDRAPLSQPMPNYTVEAEAVISIRFEVRPDGTIDSMSPVRRGGQPELENEVMRTLRDWRFSRLPSGVPQESQWGTVTFRFVLD